ncbi:MAG: hypothetical protein MK212_16135 [Saprospiraceae bacterium]|nr:hypothetical protein [Saprospiraceae bacterium]
MRLTLCLLLFCCCACSKKRDRLHNLEKIHGVQQNTLNLLDSELKILTDLKTKGKRHHELDGLYGFAPFRNTQQEAIEKLQSSISATNIQLRFSAFDQLKKASTEATDSLGEWKYKIIQKEDLEKFKIGDLYDSLKVAQQILKVNADTIFTVLRRDRIYPLKSSHQRLISDAYHENKKRKLIPKSLSKEVWLKQHFENKSILEIEQYLNSIHTEFNLWKITIHRIFETVFKRRDFMPNDVFQDEIAAYIYIQTLDSLVIYVDIYRRPKYIEGSYLLLGRDTAYFNQDGFVFLDKELDLSDINKEDEELYWGEDHFGIKGRLKSKYYYEYTRNRNLDGVYAINHFYKNYACQ